MMTIICQSDFPFRVMHAHRNSDKPLYCMRGIEPVVNYVTPAWPTREKYLKMAVPMIVIFTFFFQFGCGGELFIC